MAFGISNHAQAVIKPRVMRKLPGTNVGRRALAMAAALGLGLSVAPNLASAGPHTDVASAFDKDDPFDLFVSFDYILGIHSAKVMRENVGGPGSSPTAPLPVDRDLKFSSTRHTLVPRIAMGVFSDMNISVALPIVISDNRSLDLDGTNRTDSSTIGDGLLPMNGFNADDPGTGFPSGNELFRGPTRRGLDQIHLGLTWAPMNQQRDDTKPTWKLGAEARLAIGTTAKFDRSDPTGQTGIGRGVNEVNLWTSIAKRSGWAEPFVEIWWRAPFSTKSDSAFIEPGFGQRRTAAQQHAGTRFGFEAIFWEKPADKTRVSLDVAARLEAHFEGRAYTEMWEVFSYAGDATGGGPLILDSDPTSTGVQALSHPGVSNIENYISFSGRVGLRAELGDKVRLGFSFELVRHQAHIISFADAGVDKPTCSGSSTTGCEIDRNDVVNPGTDEVNPLHVPTIDVVGHRYRIDKSSDFNLLVDARLLF